MVNVIFPTDLKNDAEDIAIHGTLQDARRSGFETRIGMLLSLYFEEGWTREKRLALLECLEDYLQVAGDGVTHWQNWDSRRLHKFKEPHVPEVYRSEDQLEETQSYFVHVRSLMGNDSADPGNFLFVGMCIEKDFPGNRRTISGLKVYLPPRFGFESQEIFAKIVNDFSARLRPAHGSAGLGAIGEPGGETMRGAYYYPWLKQYPGLEYDAMGGYFAESGFKDQSLPRSSNWLTILGDKNVDRLGGKATIERSLLKGDGMSLTDWPGGVTIQASKHPTLGDEGNGGIPPGYRRAAQIIKPIRFEEYEFGVIKTPKTLRLSREERLQVTLDWIRRFD